VARRGDGGAGLRIEFEKLSQRVGIGLAPVGLGELLDPHRGRMQELVNHPAHRVGKLGAHCGIKFR
jgi:hypothetical protein